MVPPEKTLQSIGDSIGSIQIPLEILWMVYYKLNHPQIIHKIASIATSHGISAPLPGSLALATAAGSGTCQAANEQAASIKHGNSKSPTNGGFSWENHPSMGKSYHLIHGLNMFPVCE